jgi:hypothetical protein
MPSTNEYGRTSAVVEPQAATHYYLGLDLGQAQDYTAICIAERNETMCGNLAARSGATYQVRHLERPALGTPYPAIVARVRQLVHQPPLRGQVSVVADATGVGAAVIDLLRDAHLSAPLNAVTITGGDTVTQDGLNYRVPKRDLVSVLQVLLQTQRLKVAQALPDSDTLVRELLNFRVTVNAHAHDSYAAWREGVHDDLVLATALACWAGEHQGALGVAFMGMVGSRPTSGSGYGLQAGKSSAGWVEVNGMRQRLPWETC